MGYYHETPLDQQFDNPYLEALQDISRTGTLIVCSAGNDATTRPSFPAAFAPWSSGTSPVVVDPECPPIVSVGALNPNRETDAMFSNTGPWVTCYARGAAVMSTFPVTFQGGLEPEARTTTVGGRHRATIDPDDFSGGFGLWSGTSFAAPVMAAQLASKLGESIDSGDDPAAAVARARAAVEEVTTAPAD
jgi:subtilisin family serine protease